MVKKTYVSGIITMCWVSGDPLFAPSLSLSLSLSLFLSLFLSLSPSLSLSLSVSLSLSLSLPVFSGVPWPQQCHVNPRNRQTVSDETFLFLTVFLFFFHSSFLSFFTYFILLSFFPSFCFVCCAPVFPEGGVPRCSCFLEGLFSFSGRSLV